MCFIGLKRAHKHRGELMSMERQTVDTNDHTAWLASSSPTQELSPSLNPCELEIDLFCKGMRIHPSCALQRDARTIAGTRAGLGSVLEFVIPGSIKDVWVNVPVGEDFAQQSCYELTREQGEYWVTDERCS